MTNEAGDEPTSSREDADRSPDARERRVHDHQFRALVDAVEEYAIFRLTPDGTVASWNSGAERIKGYTAEEILGNSFSTFYTATDRSAGVPAENLAAAMEQGSIEDEGWRVRADGSRFWANVTITAIWDADGTFDGYAKVTRDMTERRERERELERRHREAEHELAEVFSRVSDAFYALDEEFRFTHVNERAEELLQHSEAALLGERLWEVFPDAAEIDEVWDSFHAAMETQEPQEYEFYFETLDFWVDATLYPSETGVSVYFRDVSDRIERERELERTLDLLEKTQHIADVRGWELDADTRDVLWTGHPDELPDVISRDELQFEAFLERYHEDDRRTVEAAIDDTLDSGDSFEEVVRADSEGDDLRWLRLQGVAVTDDGDVASIRGTAQDITERTQRERRLEEVIDRLAASNERLEQFAYAASHDLQEPLRMVSTYLRLIERRYGDALDDDGEEFLEFAVDGADRMRHMIAGLLQYSRVETQGAPLETVDLNEVFETVLDELREQLERHDADVAVGTLPRVSGDADQLQLVFEQLLTNAVEYSGDAPPRVHVDAERDETEWIVSVSDEGIGIDPDYQGQIFEVFERVHDPNDHSGTGIGLALCERIVERHGGDIWVESGLTEGATFYFTVPHAPQGDE